MHARDLRRYWPVFAILVTIAAATTLFAAFASELLEGELAAIDHMGRHWAASMRSPTADHFFGAATQLGSAAALILVTLAAAALLRHRHGGKLILPILLGPLSAAIIVELLKLLFARQRPSPVTLASFSFPSGHTAGATAVYLTLIYTLVRERMVAKIHLVWGLLIALLVGASRVYLGAHWASDVLGGWMAGAGIAISCCLLYERAVRTPTPAKQGHQ